MPTPSPWLLLRGDPMPRLVLSRAAGSAQVGQAALLDQWTVVAIGPLQQALAVHVQGLGDTQAVLLAIASGVEFDASLPAGLAFDVDGQCARRLGAWLGHGCQPLAVLVEPRGTVQFACTGASLAEAVAAVLEHRYRDGG